MPYNVICFVCTVIAIGFGSIFNLTTRRLEPATAENSQGILQRIISKLKDRLRGKGGDQKQLQTSDEKEDGEEDNGEEDKEKKETVSQEAQGDKEVVAES